MAREQACPTCGETDALRGRADEDGAIEVTCLACGARWLRDARGCAVCGRAPGVALQQRMTRYARGTLLAVVGAREVTLCPECDADMVTRALADRAPVPEGYVSRFATGRASEPAAAPAPRPAAPRVPRRLGGQQVGAPRRAAADGPAPLPADPTVRQATEHFLGQPGVDADSLTLVLLGGQLGASTRLSALDSDETAARVSGWLDDTFDTAGERRTTALATVRAAFSEWHRQGWLSRDVATRL